MGECGYITVVMQDLDYYLDSVATVLSVCRYLDYYYYNYYYMFVFLVAAFFILCIPYLTVSSLLAA